MAEKKKMSFEKALARLDEIVRMMESGDAMLDKSLALYEEGVGLVNFCMTVLDEAEQKVKLLQKGNNGEISEENFGEE